MDIHQILADEINTDPLSRGYAGMTDHQVADDINTEYRTVTIPEVSPTEIYQAIDPPEWVALSALFQLVVTNVISLPTVPTSGNTADGLLAAFGPGTTTRTNLIALATGNITRGTEIGIGEIHSGDVGFARSLP
jgi:hypothetical protein